MRKSCGYNRDVIDIVSDDNQSVSLKADFKSIENHNEEDLDNDNESIGSSVLENHFGPDIKSLQSDNNNNIYSNRNNDNNNIHDSNRNRNNGNNNDDDSEEGDDEPIIKESIYRTTTVDVNGKDTSDIYTAENDDYLDNNDYVYNDDNDNDNNDDNDNENNDDNDNDDNNNDIMNNSNNNNIFNNNDNDRISNNLSINQKKLQKRKGTFDNFKEMKYKVILPNSYGQFDTNKVTIENPMDRLLKTKQAQLFLKHYKIK
jgi:hypothetical protein